MSTSATQTGRATVHHLFNQLRDRVPAVVAVGIQAVTAVAILGPAGVVIAATTAGSWALVGAPYGLAAGHVALVALDPSTLDVVSLATVEGGFLAVLVASLARGPAARRAVTAAGVVLLAAGGVAWLTRGLLAEWAALVVAAFTFAPIGYGIYRYQLVRDGAERRDDESPTAPAPADPNS